MKYIGAKFTIDETFNVTATPFSRNVTTANITPDLTYYSISGTGVIYGSEDDTKKQAIIDAEVFNVVYYDPDVYPSQVNIMNDNDWYTGSDYLYAFSTIDGVLGRELIEKTESSTRVKLYGPGEAYHKIQRTVQTTLPVEYDQLRVDDENANTSVHSTTLSGSGGSYEYVVYDMFSSGYSSLVSFDLTSKYRPLKNGQLNVLCDQDFSITVHTEHTIIFGMSDSNYEIYKPVMEEWIDIYNVWFIDDDIPFIDTMPKLIESVPEPNAAWVTATQWNTKTWPGLPSHNGFDMWSDGTNSYYSNGSDQYVLDKTTGTWSPKTWIGLTSFSGRYIWTDGTNIYFSNGYTQYVLDPSTSTWSSKSWTGLTNFSGTYVWKSETGGIYYSNGSSQYVLNKTTGAWVKKTWSGVSQPKGLQIWTDGVNTYYSYTTAQYVVNTSTSTWSKKTWTGLTNFNGQYVWTYRGDIYYSSGTTHYVLDKETSTWIPKTWLGLTSFNGQYIWSYDDNHLYYSNYSDPYELRSRIPYRLSYLDMNESENLGEWLIDNDIPYRLSTAELVPSQNYSDLWLTELDPDAPKSDIEFDPNYRYVKLEFDVNFIADNDNSPFLQATTDLPNSNIQVSKGYYWYQWSITLGPATSVASRLYAAEESATNLSDFMVHADTYGSSVEARGSYPAIDLAMSPKKLQYTSIGDLDITGSIYSAVTNTSQYNDQRLDEYYRSYIGYTVYLNQTATGSSSSTVTVKLYYCFDQDESGYDALLAEYPNHASPYSPEPATKVPFRDDFSELTESMGGPDLWFIDDDIPFRVQFPEFKTSIPATDAWLILDDIPFRIDFPDLLESVGAPESWLQDNGWEPRRPWPRHKNIILEVQTIEDIPPVDWTKSMKQDFEFYTVDPHTWFDDKKLDNIISCNITHDTTTDKRGNASITLTEAIPECYIRTYLVVTQNGRLYKFCLGTFLYMTSSDSFDGMKHNITMTGYSPLVELEEQYPKLGYHVVGYTNRKYGAEAPMVTDEIRDIILENTRCEVESRVMINKPLLNDFVPGQNDNWLTVVNNILNASSLQSYILTVDEWGTIIIKDAPSIDDVATSFTYNDDNSSILLPTLDTFDDIYGIPNVMEVLYVGDKNLPAIRVVVKNEDEQSIVSIPRRGREIVKRYTINNIAAPLNDQTYASVYAQVEAQAYKLLEAASTIQKTISYSHGYCDVKVGDMVLINYERAGMNNVRAKVVSQRISCKPGCQVDEQAVYTKKLWNRGV